MVRLFQQRRSLAITTLVAVAVVSLVYSLSRPRYRRDYWRRGAVMSAMADSNDRFLVKQGGKWCFIDRAGNVVIAPRFDNARKFSEGLAAVAVAGWVSKKWGYIDASGEIAIEPQFGFSQEFSEGFALVTTTPTRFGPLTIGRRCTFFIDQDGNRLGGLEVDDGRSYSEGLASVSVNGTSGCIDRTGQFVIEPCFSWIGSFSEGLAAVEIRDETGEHWGFIDKTGMLVIPARFDGAGEFSEGLAHVIIDGRYGYVDRTGTVVIEPRFRVARSFSDRRAAFMDERGCYGFIDRQGRIVVVPQFYPLVEDYANGLALVDVASRDSFGSDPKYGYVDLEGNFVWPPSK